MSLQELAQRRSAKWSEHSSDVLPAWVAEMDFPLAPPVKEALETALESDDCGYAAPGSAGFADAYAGFAARRGGWQVDAAQVTPLVDLMSGVSELLHVLTERGDGVVVNPPVYHPFFSVIEEIGRRVAEVPLGGGRLLDTEGIERALADGARAILLCNPHNPTGTVATAEELEAIAAAAERHGAWVLADEIHAPLTLPGARHVPFTTVSEAAAARGIVLTSASKAFNFAGLKCALAVTAGEPAREQVAKLPTVARQPGHLGVLASVAAFNGGDEWLDDVLEILDGNRYLLGTLLSERLPEVDYVLPRAGYLAWLDCRALDLGPDPAAAFLERGSVALSPGPQFGTGGEGFARLNIGTWPELVTMAVTRMAAALGR